jgi:hypothetical protein
MKLQYTTGLILLMFINFSFAQENTVGTIVYDEEATDGGYNMIFPHNQPDAFLLDMCGNVVHTWESNDTLRPGNVIYLLENSDVITTHRPADFSGDAIWTGGAGATVERRTWDNELIWSFTRNDSAYRLHHDVEPLSNGNVLVIAWEKHDSLDCVEAGRDTTNLTGGGIWSEVVWEISPNDNMGADIIWEWAAWDHLIQDFDASKSNYGVIADNIDKIDINFGMGLPAAPDWLHINAIDYDDYSKHIMLSVPTFGEMWLIDRGNTTPGELKWRWGNPAAYDHGDAADQKLFFQHDTHWLDLGLDTSSPDYGKVGVFNNRVPLDTNVISTVNTLNPIYDEYENEYYMDSESGTYLPLDFDWTFMSPEPSDLYSNIVSSFQRLNNGNSLICSGRTGDTREYTQDGDLVWHYKTPLKNIAGVGSPVNQGTDLLPIQNLTFRAARYPADYPGLAGIELVSGAPIELNPTPLPSCLVCDLELSLDSIFFDSLGATVLVSAEGSFDINTIEWMSLADSTILPFAQALVFGTMDSGDYMITVTDVMGCVDSLVVSVIIDEVTNPNQLAFGIYPNPSNGALKVTLSNHSHNAVIDIYDMQGRLVFNRGGFTNSGNIALDLQDLENGTYVLVIRTNEGSGNSRIVIQN